MSADRAAAILDRAFRQHQAHATAEAHDHAVHVARAGIERAVSALHRAPDAGSQHGRATSALRRLLTSTDATTIVLSVRETMQLVRMLDDAAHEADRLAKQRRGQMIPGTLSGPEMTRMIRHGYWPR
ncbi:hypothetical protein [Microbacterium sp.]|uniref:hypothetical protein n=1 Tax=Microbacterium sp. TaxID=51671 RepID=UPI00261D5ED0|nr:hypothetical protein [Microbacterium sp.]